MAYSTLPIVAPGDVIRASTWGNIARGNEEYLFSGRPTDSDGGVGIAVNTSSTSYAEMDATNLKKNITVNNGRLLVVFSAYISTDNVATYKCYVTVYVDGVDIGDATYGIYAIGNNTARSFSWMKILTGLSVGAHEIKIMGKVENVAQTLRIGQNTIGAGSGWHPTVFDILEV